MKRVLFLILVFFCGAAFLGVGSGGSRPLSKQQELGASTLKGRVYDAERRLLAYSEEKKGFILLPQVFQPSRENLSRLAAFTGKSREELTLLLATAEAPVFLGAPAKEYPQLKGLLWQSYTERQYPYGPLFASFLGTAEKEGPLEAYYQKILAREGSFLRTAVKVEFQKALSRDLLRALKRLHARAGCAVVLDLSSGRIKALVSKGAEDLLLAPELRLSWVGSPFEEAYYDSMYEGLTSFLRALGFGEPTGIDLPGENPGIMPPEVSSLEEVRPSLLQTVRALAALRTGKIVSPKLGVEAGLSRKEKYLINVETEELEDLVPREKGGVWWYGGSRKAGVFLMIGLWPRKDPTLAFGLYAKGVRAWGLPCYYTRFIPQAVKVMAADLKSPSGRPKRAARSHRARMPNLHGLTLKAALEKLVPLGLEVHFSGFGVTVKQWPAPGTPLKGIKDCRLVLR